MKKTARRYTKFQLFLKKLIPSFAIVFAAVFPIAVFESFIDIPYSFSIENGLNGENEEINLLKTGYAIMHDVIIPAFTEHKISYSDYIVLKNTFILALNGLFRFPYVYGVMIFITLLLAWIWSARKYSELKVYYDTEDFRKELTNTMAHDLKTPLMAASGYTENLLSGIYPEKNIHYAESALENIRHMDSIISDVLELSKLESGSEVLNRTSVSLKPVAETIIDKYDEMIKERNLNIKVSGEAEIKADEALIKRACENLITNAVKYAEEGTEIKVDISANRFTVENRFSGSDITDTRELLKPFVKGDKSRSSKKGSGLGLSIVKNICDLHGFRFEIKAADGIFAAETTFKKKRFK